MDEATENRFKWLRKLSYEEKLQRLDYLEEEIERALKVFNAEKTRGEEKTDAHNDYKHASEELNYLKSLMMEELEKTPNKPRTKK